MYIQHDHVGFILGMQVWFNIGKSINITYYINRIKNKNHTISNEAEKSFSKIQHPFMIKTFNKVGKDRHYFNTSGLVYEICAH